jgi:type VI protein secretion system component Hcp
MRLTKGTLAAVAAGVTGVATGLGIHAAAADTSSGGTIFYACVGKALGAVRVVAAGTACATTEYPISWNSAGPTGVQGPAGTPGSPGATGATGPAGHDAPDHTPDSRTVAMMTVVPDSSDPDAQLYKSTGPGGAFEIKDFSFSVENPTTIGSATSGAGGGKNEFAEFNITKNADNASPAFFNNAAAADPHLKTVTLNICGQDCSTTIETVTLTDVSVADDSQSNDGSPGGQTLDKVTFTYGGIRVDGPASTSSPAP